MKKKQLKKVIRRVMEEILAEEQHDEIFDWLDTLAAKVSADREIDFISNDISWLTEKECSKKETQHIADNIVKAIKEELKQEHCEYPDIRKEHSFYVTTRLMIALRILEEDPQMNFSKMNNREKFCYMYIYMYNGDVCVEHDQILRVVSYLDS